VQIKACRLGETQQIIKRALTDSLFNGGNDEACLEIFALNESTDFASSANRTFAKVLRSLQKFRRTRTGLRQPAASSHLYILRLKKEPQKWFFF